jgi:hypothetical protein
MKPTRAKRKETKWRVFDRQERRFVSARVCVKDARNLRDLFEQMAPWDMQRQYAPGNLVAATLSQRNNNRYIVTARKRYKKGVTRGL